MICDDPSQLAVTGQSMVMVMVVCAIALVAVGAVVVVGARRRAGVALLLVAALAIVGLGSGVTPASAATDACGPSTSQDYTVGGSVSGLTGTVALTLNGSDNLTVPSNGPFTFSTPVASGATYTVTVATQPATQTCTVTNGTGTVAATNITNVQVACIDNSYTVGGSVSGLTGTVALTLNGSDNLTVPSNGPFTFSTPVASGATYTVTVATQPATQTCTVTNGTGTVAATNITNVQVACIDNSYTVGGSISGLTGTVALTLNGSDNLTVPSNGPFTFSTPVASGATYTVTVATQPATQTCTVTNGTGTVAATNITNVQVACIDD